MMRLGYFVKKYYYIATYRWHLKNRAKDVLQK